MRLTGLWWWIDRWRKSTAYVDMSLAEQGAYRNLLDEASLRGGAIPNDENILAKACGDPRQWRKVRDKVMERFWLSDEGWRNETLDDVMSESAARAAKQKRYRQGKAAPYVEAIVARDGMVCGICAGPVAADAYEIDHIIPTSRGGDPEHVDNLQLSHPKCNYKKGARSSARHQSLPALSGRRIRSNAQSNARRTFDDLSDSDTDKKEANRSERGLGETNSTDDVGRFVDRFRELHQQYRGVAYLGNPQKDYQSACELVGAFGLDLSIAIAAYGLNDPDPFMRKSTLTVTMLKSRASKYAEELKAKKLA